MRWTEMAAIAALIIVAAAPATAQVERAAPQPPTVLSINAEGKSEARPDMARVQLGVVTTARTAREATEENARLMSRLTQALRRVGVAERSIQTSNIWARPNWIERNGDREPVISGYTVHNTVSVEVRDIDNTSRVIDAAVTAGGNTIHGVHFAHQNPQAQLDVARRNAIADARHRAELYAEALGLRIVRVANVTESGARVPDAIVVTGSRLRAPGGESTPVEAGEIETRANVSVTFELRT
jgi:uncharacterized protein